MHSLSLTSSFTSIYYAKQLKPSIRTQLPIRHFQDIIEFQIKELLPTTLPPIIVQFFNLEPDLITQFGPITTFGPILQSYQTLEDSSIKTQSQEWGEVILKYFRYAPCPKIQSPGLPISNQKLFCSEQPYSFYYSAIFGNISFSTMQCPSGILLNTETLSRQIPALILLLTGSFGFQMKEMTCPSSFAITTPNLVGSQTLANTIDPYPPLLLWNSLSYCKGKSQTMSLLNTKKRPSQLSFFKISAANLRGPAVPKAQVSWEQVSLILYLAQRCCSEFLICSA